MRPALVVVGAATLVVGSLALLLVLLIVMVDWPESDCVTCTVTFHNTTDSRLCAFQPECDRPIEPISVSHTPFECSGQIFVSVYTEEGREIYRGLAACNAWDDGLIVINRRDGEFVVADTVNAEILPAREP